MSDTSGWHGLEGLAHWIEQECGADPGEGQRLRDRLAEWAQRITADARAEAGSLRQRLADLGDQYKTEREARQALLNEAIDLPERAIMEIERANGDPIEADRMEALEQVLIPTLKDLGFKPKIWWQSRAAARITIGGELARHALEDALERLRGTRSRAALPKRRPGRD